MGSFNRLLKSKQLLQCQVLEFRQFQKHPSFPSSTAFPLHWAPSLWQLVVLSGQKCPRGTFSGCRGAECLHQDTPCESIPQDCRVEFLQAPEGRLSTNSTCEGKVLATQSCLTLCNSMDCPSGSSVHGILQARILEWAAISFSRGIFLTQELNLGLRYCRQIPYQLSHQGSP